MCIRDRFNICNYDKIDNNNVLNFYIAEFKIYTAHLQKQINKRLSLYIYSINISINNNNNNHINNNNSCSVSRREAHLSTKYGNPIESTGILLIKSNT